MLTFRLERLVLRGPQYRLLLIAALIGLLSVVAGTVIHFYDPNFDGGFPQAVWWSFLRLTDPGYLGDDVGTLERTVSTILTVLGYVVFLGALVAIMTQWLNERMALLEAGLTPITQHDHVLILGWTNRTALVLRELLLSEGRVRRFLRRHGARSLRIAILADSINARMRLDLRLRLGRLWNEKQIVLRSGTPLAEGNLRRVNFVDAAAVILPSADFTRHGADQADTRAIKTLLSMSSHPTLRDARQLPLAVAEIRDERKINVARGAYRGPIEILASDSIISRLITQNVRHPGLSHVFSELLSHGRGNEIYIREAAELAGMRFSDAVDYFENSVLLGIVRPSDGGYRPLLNPPGDIIIETGDRLAVIARNYASIDTSAAAAQHRTRAIAPLGAAATDPADAAVSDVPAAREKQMHAETGGTAALTTHPQPSSAIPDAFVGARSEIMPEGPLHRVLVLGWSHKGPALLHEFDSYPHENFDIDIISTATADEREAALRDAGFTAERIRYSHITGDFTAPSVLARARPGSYRSIVLLGTDRFSSDEESDARSIVAYLLLRDVLNDDEDPAIVVELLDSSNVGLFRERRGEVLISPTIMSHMLAQVALRREMRVVFDELFGPEGAEIMFRTSADLGLAGDVVTFGGICASAALHGEIALGVHTGGGEVRSVIGMKLNPSREQTFQLTADDRVIVLR